jgi:release factor glutamine methyltransferase
MGVSIARAITEAAANLDDQGISQPRLEASLLIAHTLQCNRTFVIGHRDRELSNEELQAFHGVVHRRAGGEPLQYITGHQEFFKLDFGVTPDVLIPRPETELIVEAVLGLFPRTAKFTFADVGTGSGCIAISILHERLTAHATALDKSMAALAVAQRNASRHQVIDRLRFIESDLFSAMPQQETFDLIVSNPPYVRDGELNALQREVQREPRTALAGGEDGLDVIRRLLAEAPERLHARGYLIFEFGINQDEAIAELVAGNTWELIEMQRDLQQIPRTIILQKR